MTQLRVLIADDEALARQRLTRLLSAMPDVELMGECVDGPAVLQRIGAGDIDVVVLDVQMPQLLGTEAVALWPANGPFIIFCTAHAEHAVTAFEAGAVDYVLKPVEPQRLAQAMARARSRRTPVVSSAKVDRIPVSTRQGVLLLDPQTVTHAVLDGELVTVHTHDGSHLTDSTLQELHDRLGTRVERVHRKALLNLGAVQRLEPLETGGYLARLKSGESVEVSRQSARELRRRLGLRKSPGDEG